MHYLTYVVGDEPDRALERTKGIRWDWYVIGGRWGHLSRRARQRLPAPYNIVFPNGAWLSKNFVGEAGMKAALRALGPKVPITIVDLHN